MFDVVVGHEGGFTARERRLGSSPVQATDEALDADQRDR